MDEVASQSLDMSEDMSTGTAVLAEVVVHLSGTKSIVAEFTFVGWRQQLQGASLSEQAEIALLMADGAVAPAELPMGDFRKSHLVFDLPTVAGACVGGSWRVGIHCQVKVLEVYNKIGLGRGGYKNRSVVILILGSVGKLEISWKT